MNKNFDQDDGLNQIVRYFPVDLDWTCHDSVKYKGFLSKNYFFYKKKIKINQIEKINPLNKKNNKSITYFSKDSPIKTVF